MNIAVFCPNWIGDAVMATPALRALRRHFASDRIFAVLKPYVGGVYEGCDWFDDSIGFQGGHWSQSVFTVADRLRRLGIDLAVLFPNSFRSAFTARLGGCQRIVGYARDGRSWLLTDRLKPLRGPDRRLIPSPIIDAYNRLVQHVGCPHPGFKMELFTTPEDEAAADAVWRKRGLSRFSQVIAFHVGAAYGSAKQWPMAYFAELARMFTRQSAAVLVLCGPKDRQLSAELVQRASDPAVVSLADCRLSLGLVKACVRRCDLLVTTDSGPRHFAAAFDRPVVTLFGPTYIAWTETYYAKAVHLQKPVECGPCQLRECPLDHRCMRQLLPQEVFEASMALLARSYPSKRLWTWLPFRHRDKRAS